MTSEKAQDRLCSLRLQAIEQSRINSNPSMPFGVRYRAAVLLDHTQQVIEDYERYIRKLDPKAPV